MDKKTATDDLTEEKIAEYREAFAVFDKDSDGVVTTQELGSVLRAIGQNPTAAEIEDMIREADCNGDGVVQFNEFVKIVRKREITVDPHQEMLAAFRVFDKDGNGLISAEELKSVMLSLGDKMTDEDVAGMLNLADTDDDGNINYAEFVTMMNTM